MWAHSRRCPGIRLARLMRPKQPSFCAMISTGRSSPTTRVATAASTWAGTFFKLLLCLLIGLWVPGARHEFPPTVTSEETIDRAVIDLVPHLSFKSSLDFPCRRNASLLSLIEKGREKGSFFFQVQIVTTTTSFTWGLNRADSQPIVGGNHMVNHGNRGPGMPGDLRRFSWIDQRIVDNEPALADPRTGS